MTRRRLLLANLRRMTIGAVRRLLVLFKLFFNCGHLGIRRLLIVFVAACTRSDWNIGGQSPYAAGARDVDVTGRTFHDVLTLAAFMIKFGRNSPGQRGRSERRRGFVTTGAVNAGRVFVLPVAVEACIVRLRHRLERANCRYE